ncbi:hypothetical protein H5410_022440 [Solanum commersonii]|uniref:Uncharacterized protein n=1 Tax=Solanum commersonii TaxID=4109 RepID=A0A9J5ZGS0_SOLCO|nr:hypothetical protein H5410_022440 [Solanum commersonii]
MDQTPSISIDISKLFHDPLAMKNQSIDKVNKEVPSSFKVNVEPPPPLPKKKAEESMKYVIKHTPIHSLKFGATYNMNFLEEFKLSIGGEGIDLFKNTIFGPYLNIMKCNYQGQITKYLLILELQQDNPNVLHIRHTNENILHFSINEYAIIASLKCTDNMYFPNAKTSVSKSRLVQRFLIGDWKNNQNAIYMMILYFIHTFVFSKLGDTPIMIDEFLMIEND